MLKFGVKSAILGTAVYYTVEKGVWKDSSTSSELYNELEKGVSPYVGELKKQVPYELPPLPSNDKVSYLCKHYWNTGVKATFRFLINLPDHATNAVTKTYNSLSAALEPVEPSSKSSDGKK
ncbi:MICOS complex subunit MIC13 homolog QIL1 [Aricia agestis]|uniref:MICOS complex subunit MIC13 homolog QIL1 n=1 Tax=Aricia agestis TaxID=91739 RepID=UPI001C209AA0|nr:MICOS complex subunit MIC13 homolog QIL1 [Aricia agestis]